MSTSVWLQKQTLYMTCSNQPQIRDALDKDLFAWGVFEDLRKIFDTVSHSILISKLEYYSVHGIPIVWFKSYLQIRFQYISVDGTDSELLLIKHQVLQGSILGSILFLLYINDLHKANFSENLPLCWRNKLSIWKPLSERYQQKN